MKKTRLPIQKCIISNNRVSIRALDGNSIDRLLIAL